MAIARMVITGSLCVALAWCTGCAAPFGSGANLKGEVTVAPGISVDGVLQAAMAAGEKMNYSVVKAGNQVTMDKKLPSGTGHFAISLANHKNRITVTAVPSPAGGPPVVRVVGEYLGDPRDRNIYNCLDCDVNQIKKAIQ